MNETKIKQKLADNWFGYLQLEICRQFESLENLSPGGSKKFVRRSWKKENEHEWNKSTIEWKKNLISKGFSTHC